ncbi:nuclear transport factor 2 family protein [Nocardioidaceae bacterium]|nr:nuclear transport factor 2 family protein [Nocardioidaceae bacterium]
MGERGQVLTEHERDLLWEQISDLEHRGWRALCGGSGGHFYADLMTEDGLMVLAGGRVMDREEVRGSLGEVSHWDTFEISEEKLVTPGADVAVLVYLGVGHRGEETFTARMSSTYVRTSPAGAGPWRLALYTQTPSDG